MLFYNFDELDNFVTDNLITNLIEEKETVKKIINLYSNKKNLLSDIITNTIDLSVSIEKDKLDDFQQLANLLKASFEEIINLEDLSSKLLDTINSTISLFDKGIQYNKDEIKANLIEYNKQQDSLFNKMLEFENVNLRCLDIINTLFSKKKKNELKNISNDISSAKVNIELEPKDYNTLIISEKDQKAYLPFFYNDIKKIYEKNNSTYKTMQDVVDNLYVIPLDRFKNSSISRFRESFKLIRTKENLSITKALDLGLELMFKYELNPIVIAACRNLDELDIYLDCLQENELNDFRCFEIKFEVLPKIIKNRKKDTFK